MRATQAERHLLCLREARDQQAQSQRAHEIQRHREEQEPARPGHRQPNSSIATSTIPIAEASDTTKYGIVLPSTNDIAVDGAIRTCPWCLVLSHGQSTAPSKRRRDS